MFPQLENRSKLYLRKVSLWYRSVFVHVTVPLTGVLRPHALGQLETELAENTQKHTVTADTVITVHEAEQTTHS